MRPGGRVGILHFLVPSNARTSLRFERVYGITQGLGYRIRAFTVYVKTPPGLFDSVDVLTGTDRSTARNDRSVPDAPHGDGTETPR